MRLYSQNHIPIELAIVVAQYRKS